MLSQQQTLGRGAHRSVLPRPGSGRWRPLGAQRGSRLDASSPGDASIDAAGALLQQLTDERAWSSLGPHFGSRLAAQLAQQAAAWLPQGGAVSLHAPALPPLPPLPRLLESLPQLPRVQLPAAPQLPTGAQLHPPSLVEASSSAAGLVAALQQQLLGWLDALSPLQQQLVGNTQTLEPHFGSRAALEALQRLTAAAAAAAPDLPSLDLLDTAQLPDLMGLRPGSGAAALVEAWAAGLADRVAGEAPAAAVAAAAAQLQASLAQLPQTGMGGHDFGTVCVVAVGALAAIAAAVPPASAFAADGSAPLGGGGGGDESLLTHDYDPVAAAAYWRRRPLQVAQRAAQVADEAARLGLALLGDLWSNRLQANERLRAVQLRSAIERLGPAYVKVAQALSTRVDLLTPAYFDQIQMLQDRVPPFPCEDAKAQMAAAFGMPVEEALVSLSATPVAAASLGQVYRGRLAPQYGGGDVAVKVQRPGVLEQVSLDLYLMRQAALALQSVPDTNTDWAALIDTWALRFLHEMDYRREARNAERFAADMAAAGVEGIAVADVVHELSSDVVLTTQWVEGEKLSDSSASDVRELCNTLLNAYLIQLLDTGFLHADPHPGNLIRTPDGKVCVLDFGLMTEVTAEQRVALVEYIAHLTIQDWPNVARDLQTLGFIPPEAGDPATLGLVEPLGRVLQQLSGGGGAAKLNIDAVMAELEALGRDYPFSIPPFFALILRAFSVIEGIALGVDPDYSIVQECFPYLARRLLSDDDPRMRAALRDVLYGGRTHLDVDRLVRVADAFGAFTTSGLQAPPPLTGPPAPPQQPPQQQPRALAQPQAPQPAAGRQLAQPSGSGGGVLDPAVRDALVLVFSKRGSYVQELLAEELVAAADALSRDAASEVLRAVLGSAPAALAVAGVQALGPARRLLLPLPTPLEVIARLQPTLALSADDQEALGMVRGVLGLLGRMQAGAGAGGPAGGGVAAAAADAARAAAELRPLLLEIAPGLQATAELFVRALVRRASLRAAEVVSVQSEYDGAMAALAFMPIGTSDGTSGSGSSGGGGGGGLAARFGTTPGLGGGHDGFGGGGHLGAGGLPHALGQFGEAATRRPDAGEPGLAEQLPTAGQVVVGLAAAPLLLALAPVALAGQLQAQRQRRQRQV